MYALDLKDEVLRVGLLPSDIVKMSNSTISLNQASRWLVMLKDGNLKLSAPTLNLIRMFCKEKEVSGAVFDGLIRIEHIRAGSKTLEDGLSGIYFLLHEGSVVYVGQSANCHKRVVEHKSSGKEFDSFYVYNCHRDKLNEMEALYIMKYSPKYNKGFIPYNGSGSGSSAKSFADGEVVLARGRVQYVMTENGIKRRTDYDGVVRDLNEAEEIEFGGYIRKVPKKEKAPKPVVEESGFCIVTWESKGKGGRPRKEGEVSERAMRYRRAKEGLSRPVGRPFVSPD